MKTAQIGPNCPILKIYGIFCNFWPPAEQKSAFFLFLRQSVTQNVAKREIPSKVLKPQSILKRVNLGWEYRVLTLSFNIRLKT